jgi:hypothetical protein
MFATMPGDTDISVATIGLERCLAQDLAAGNDPGSTS